MKKLLATLLTVSVLAVLVLGTAAVAQRGYGRGMGKSQDMRACNGAQMIHMGQHEAMYMMRIRSVLHQLNLTDEQRNKIHNVLLKHRKNFRANFTSSISNREELWKAMHTENPSTQAIAKAMEPMKTRQLTAAREAAKMWSEIMPILTPEQRAKAPEIISNIDFSQMQKRFKGNKMRGNRGRRRCGLGMKKNRMDSGFGYRLGLTNEQRDKIRTIFSNHKSTLQNFAASRAEAIKGLLAAVCATEYNEDAINKAVDKLFSTQQQAVIERAKIFSEIYPILTPEQREKIATPMRKKHSNRRHQRQMFF